MNTTHTKIHKDISTVKFGSHMIFDAYGCNGAKLDSKDFCEKLLNDCTEICGMHQLLAPVVVQATPNTAVGGKDPGGYSGFCIIQESHISIHTFAKRGFVTMDIYSCKVFEPQEVIQYLKNALEAKDYDVIFMDRGLKYPSEDIYN
jgi:S-adenosylmethionine decarboxylase